MQTCVLRDSESTWESQFGVDSQLRFGEGEIRTPETLSRLLAFQASAFDHSATSPRSGPAPSVLGRVARCLLRQRRNHGLEVFFRERAAEKIPLRVQNAAVA